MTIIDIMKCKDGVVILQGDNADAYYGDWMILDFLDKPVEEVKKYRRSVVDD